MTAKETGKLSYCILLHIFIKPCLNVKFAISFKFLYMVRSEKRGEVIIIPTFFAFMKNVVYINRFKLAFRSLTIYLVAQ